jgi:predicted transcriptional regulator
MIWEGIEILPVTTRNKKAIGVITRNDVLKALLNVPYWLVKTGEILTDVSLWFIEMCLAIWSIMIWEGIEILPVTTRNKKAIGVITRNDVLKAMQLIGTILVG